MLLFCLCMVFLAGCGEAKVPDVVDKPTVAIGREGEITVWQIGDFDKSYYNVAELANMAAEEVKEYNAAKGSETVVVEKAENLPEGTDVFTIPAGRYAKFVVKGDMHQAVADFWSEFQKMDLPRSYVCDFEEYQDDNMEETEIHIYIGLRD